MRVAVEQSQRFLGIVHHIMHPPTASGVQSDRTHLEVRAGFCVWATSGY